MTAPSTPPVDWKREFEHAAAALKNALAGVPVRDADEIITRAERLGPTSKLSGHDRHLVETDFPNGMRLTIVREDDYDAVAIWSEDGESIFTQADVPAISRLSAAPDAIGGGEQPLLTDEMVEAGAEALFECYGGYDDGTRAHMKMLAHTTNLTRSRRCLIAALSAASTHGGGWQPIETAPFTFTTIFGGCEYDKWLDWSLLGRFDSHGFVAWVGGMDAGEWLYRDDTRCCGETEPPTHWMPLPEAPSTTAGEGDE